MSAHPLSDHRWLVLKFGGTSVSSRERWDRIGELALERAHSHDARVLVVVSALTGVTNELQAVAEGASEAKARVDALIARHRDFARELGLDAEASIGVEMGLLRSLVLSDEARTRSLHWQAAVLAKGEALSSRLGTDYLRSQGMDAELCNAWDWLVAQPLPNQSEWSQRLSVSCNYAADSEWRDDFASDSGETTRSGLGDDPLPRILVTQGFVAGHPDGGFAILGRGGSDTSAAYFGALLRAQRVEIWTDVPGMFSADPRAVPDARLLARLDYAEAQEIATTGARVLHPRAIAPCRDAGVPISILDTTRPHLPGTRINGAGETVPGVKAISSRSGILLVSMETVGMWQQVGFLADIFERFKRHGLSVDLIGSSETNVTVSLDPADNLVSSDVLSRLSADLAQVCRVKVIAPCTAITLVGRGMRSLLHRLSDIWAAFGRERVHLISQSSNDLNLTFVIDEADADGLIPQLHAQLIRSGAMPVEDASVFGPSWRELNQPRAMRAPAWWRACSGELQLRADAGTPRYVYHLPTLRERARGLRALASVDRHFYALKANAHPEVLRALAQEGFGFECVSQGELERVFATVPGIDPANVLFTPSFAPRSEYVVAFGLGVTVTLDNVEALQRWPDLFRGQSLWLRLDLGRGDGHHAKVRTGGSEAKFGLPLVRLREFTEAASALQVRITGLHAHLGSGIDAPTHWTGVYAELAGIADGIASVETIDVGGGLPVPYTPDAQPFDMQAFDTELAAIKSAYPRYRLAIEPGRYLVAECGVLLLHATQVVEKDGVRRLGVDAGMNALVRPALYDAYHGIHVLGREQQADVTVFDVVGPICESGDVLGQHRRLPAAITEGDVILIADAGAYGASMASTYNLRALPEEVILDDALPDGEGRHD
ncbi:MAG TPA: bifunctional aspartate kinase/diaminopimelate decarboxylase [Xanthomonadaceae bacterium]|nr:bifunctional aspartate kinase/diaminopimelate decarboxylase [Xanthomonadaceae bacterium]